MKFKRLFTLLLTISIICTSLCSCGAKDYAPCRDVLGALIDSEVGLPAGKAYDMRAPEGDGEYLPESLLGTLYGNGGLPPVASAWIDCALFLSLGEHPCEFAVFLCDSNGSAVDTARILCSRLDSLKTIKGGGEYDALLGGARVCIIKNYVVFLISSDSDAAEKTARRAIG
jgi:hypothetical protein